MLDKLVLNAFYNVITSEKIELFEKYASLRTNHITIALENIYQEHNASAVLRSCEAFGIQQLHVIEKNNTYKVQRDIARGAGRWVDLINYSNKDNPTDSCVNSLQKKGYKIVATTPHEKSFQLKDLPLDKPLAIFFGTEKKGISTELTSKADYLVGIPMYGFSESFNVSVSVALVLQKLRERLQDENVNFLMNGEEQTKLKIRWATKILRDGDKIEQEIRKRLKAHLK